MSAPRSGPPNNEEPAPLTEGRLSQDHQAAAKPPDTAILSPAADGIPSTPPRGPEAHKAMARQLRIPGNSAAKLIVLAPDNDPFYKGTPAHIRDAEWFAGLWDRFGYQYGVHLRRVHYQILSNELKFSDGTPYENTERCWGRLCGAGAAARILGLVDVEAFVDRRNPEAVINHMARQVPLRAPYVSFGTASLTLPELDLSGFADIKLDIGSPIPGGFGYDPADQPVLLEVWVEKSTMGDVLIPQCQRERMNYVEGAGFESITQSVAFLRRAQEHSKPAHIVYISDFDPGGAGMPVGVARQVQFWLEQLAIDVDVTIDTAVLTHEQCVEFELPRTPIKDGDRRRGAFEARYGAGATELDALEALHPGSLGEIVRQAMEPFVDRGLPRRLATARQEAQQRINAAWTAAAGQEVDEAAQELSRQASAVAAEQVERIRETVEDALGQLDQFTEAAEQLKARAEQIAARLNIDLPERPEPETAGLDDDRLLFDSRRHWLDQLAVFKERQSRS
jgi:hypothetical protein